MLKRFAVLALCATLLLAVAAIAPFGSIPSLAAQALPASFEDTFVARLQGPTAFAFLPDSSMLVTERAGRVRVIGANGTLRQDPVLTLNRVCSNFERGLLGIAVDPQFATNRYVYLYYTYNKFNQCPQSSPTNPNNPVNRVSRFVLQTNPLSLTNEVALVDNIPSPNGNHNAGDLHFGKDDYLYISIGDGGADYNAPYGGGGNNDAARDENVLLGKILRITRDGGIPADNPYVSTGDSGRCHTTGRTTAKRCQETFAWGLRNPFRMAFDPDATTTRFFINDVGQNAWEEIDEGKKGADYGWNVREGHCANGSTQNCGAPPAGMTNPVFDYGRGEGCNSITGGAFVPNGVWPAEYNDAYLYGDYACNRIFTLTPQSSGGFTRSPFSDQVGAVIHMGFGPYGSTQALYYTTFSDLEGRGAGQVRRITYKGAANQAPVARLSVTPAYGSAPLLVTFNAAASSDPENDTLSYIWDFGEGQPPTTTTTSSTTHVYQNNGVYTAKLIVRDSKGAASEAISVRIDVGNTPPSARILAPTPDTTFAVGDTIALRGSATDPDGDPTTLRWTVLLHHDTHTHPALQQEGETVTLIAPAPEDVQAASNSYLEIRLVAIDSKGRESSEVTQRLMPRKVPVTFVTAPSEMSILVNGMPLTGRQTITSWEGYQLQVGALTQPSSSGWFRLDEWSQGGPAVQTITTPASAATYTATFTRTEIFGMPIMLR